MDRIIGPFVRFIERWMPDSFVFALILTFITLLAVPILTESSFMQGVDAWGGGIWNLLAFTTQIATTLVTGYALANTPIIKKLLKKFANLPRTYFQAYVLTVFVAAIFNWISWSLGLIAGAIIAKEVAIAMKKKGISIHYPLLVASAYSGYVIFSLGVTSTIGLSIATEKHMFQELIGIVPTSETLFSPWNIAVVLIIAFTLPFIMALMHPKKNEDIVELNMSALEEVAAGAEVANHTGVARKTPAARMENSIIFNIIIGLMGFYLIFKHFSSGGGLDLNIVNLLFLMLAVIFSQSPIQFVNLIYDGAKTVGSLILQYPFYAAIMGIMSTTGMANVISEWFVAFSTAETLPFFTFLSAGLLNTFIPSGGGQWAVQGPIVLQAANELGADVARVSMAVAYGDGWTNMIQPFWALPLLAIAGLKVQHMMGYTLVALIWSGLIFGIALLL